ncbi:hypothetical protein FQV27_11045 [Paracoccus aurantiacus]|uniref:Uncharacterized protein n=1 Tax=Paracoccus aurantiacus TaxID=2599412 RepID=A0A5C6S4L5_9RHOB|nr:DUF6476 family protein [Paracoccus aurantiacus]TXB68523.1 hypothetical protein FQV27_11045 [Paracoccus aurantiacus]
MKRQIDHVDVQGEPVPHLRFLKLMVGGLAVAMVLGLAAIVAILWIRLNSPVLPELPDTVALPSGSAARAVTFSEERLIVVTDKDELLIYGRDGALEKQIRLDQP